MMTILVIPVFNACYTCAEVTVVADYRKPKINTP